ncbi:MAG: DUF362 domain-containing protein [Clostridia bacterium]|nr:DUF362 domain-containing protein [Clostridia bacterium]
MYKSKVYFTKEISPSAVVKMFNVLNKDLPGRLAVKVHSGEKGNQNYIKPAFFKPIIDQLGGTVVECNTAYPGARNSSVKHRKLIKEHGWSDIFAFDLLDESGPDLALKVPHGQAIKQNYVGKNLASYDSMLVLSHFKGHPMGGFGGALKQLSIGCASSEGKSFIHSAGKTKDQNRVWDEHARQNDFLAAMADAASSVVTFFHGNMAFINVMVNLSVDCDCCEVAEDPCMKDIGILSSLDPVAIDQACIDLVKASEDKGRDTFMERVNSRNGLYTIEVAENHGFGSRAYELIEID